MREGSQKTNIKGEGLPEMGDLDSLLIYEEGDLARNKEGRCWYPNGHYKQSK